MLLNESRIDETGAKAILYQLPRIDREELSSRQPPDDIGPQFGLIDRCDNDHGCGTLCQVLQSFTDFEDRVTACDSELHVSDTQRVSQLDRQRALDPDDTRVRHLAEDGRDLSADLGGRGDHV